MACGGKIERNIPPQRLAKAIAQHFVNAEPERVRRTRRKGATGFRKSESASHNADGASPKAEPTSPKAEGAVGSADNQNSRAEGNE